MSGPDSVPARMHYASLGFRIVCTGVAICGCAAASRASPLLGVFGDNSMERVVAFEKWLGRPVDTILCTIDFEKWENYRYTDWPSKTVYGARGNRRLVYDVPIIIKGASYELHAPPHKKPDRLCRISRWNFPVNHLFI